jgi:hypothetical protein
MLFRTAPICLLLATHLSPPFKAQFEILILILILIRNLLKPGGRSSLLMQSGVLIELLGAVRSL